MSKRGLGRLLQQRALGPGHSPFLHPSPSRPHREGGSLPPTSWQHPRSSFHYRNPRVLRGLVMLMISTRSSQKQTKNQKKRNKKNSPGSDTETNKLHAKHVMLTGRATANARWDGEPPISNVLYWGTCVSGLGGA